MSTHPKPNNKKPKMKRNLIDNGLWLLIATAALFTAVAPAQAQDKKPKILFTDYYAEASCTAGRANFIMGELPIRTGMTTVGQAGAKIGIPAEACTIATALKAQGYATGQFGKNHLGDLNEFLPTVHGFDEFFGYLYHLDAMEDLAHPDPHAHRYPPFGQVREDAQLGEWLVGRGSRHGSAR